MLAQCPENDLVLIDPELLLADCLAWLDFYGFVYALTVYLRFALLLVLKVYWFGLLLV